MLDALLSSVGCFGGADEFRYVAGEHHMLPLRFVCNRKVRVARNHPVTLDEARPPLLALTPRFPPLVGVADRNGTGRQKGMRTVHNDASRNNVRSDSRPSRHLRAPLFDWGQR